MAGAGYKLFNTGDVLTAAQVNTYLNEQTVMVFASSAARTSALSGVLAEGMVSYLQDTNAVEVYNGTAWVGVSGAGDVTEVQAGTGISVASGTGPIPVVTNTMATAIDAEGDLIIGDAADAFQRLAIGSNTHVLTVDTSIDGKIKWAAPSSGALTLVKTQTIGTTVSSIAVTSVFSSTYDNYLILITGGVMSGSKNFQLQLGSTTSGYYESTYYFGPASGTINPDPGNGVANFRYAGTGSTDGFSGIVYLQGPNIAKPTFYKSDVMRAVSNRTYDFSLGTEDSSTQHTGFTLLVDGAGTATGGAIKVYGYQN